MKLHYFSRQEKDGRGESNETGEHKKNYSNKGERLVKESSAGENGRRPEEGKRGEGKKKPTRRRVRQAWFMSGPSSLRGNHWRRGRRVPE